MQGGAARSLLKALGATSFLKTGQYLNGNCPFAPWRHSSGVDKHPSFGIKLSGESHYFCFSCGSSGPLSQLVFELTHLCQSTGKAEYDFTKALSVLESAENELEINDWEEVTFGGTRVDVVPEWWLDTFGKANTASRAMHYLIRRGVSPLVSGVLDLRYDTQRDCLCFPARDFDGRLIGMRGRRVELVGEEPSDIPRFHEYKFEGRSNSGQVWLGEHLVDLGKPIVLVEGNFDYCRVFETYSNVLAAQTATLSNDKIKRLLGAWSIILCFDNDLAGQRGAQKVKHILGKECVIQEVTYPKGCKDAGSMSNDAISEMLSQVL